MDFFVLKTTYLRIKNIVSIIVIIIIFLCDIVIFYNVVTDYNSPYIINEVSIRESHYTFDLAQEGWRKVKNDWYYCENAKIVRNKIIDLNGNKYYLNNEGKLVTNKKDYEIEGIKYNIDNNGLLTN